MGRDDHPTDDPTRCVHCGQLIDDLDLSAVYITEEGITCATCQNQQLRKHERL